MRISLTLSGSCGASVFCSESLRLLPILSTFPKSSLALRLVTLPPSFEHPAFGSNSSEHCLDLIAEDYREKYRQLFIVRWIVQLKKFETNFCRHFCRCFGFTKIYCFDQHCVKYQNVETVLTKECEQEWENLPIFEAKR